MKPTPTIPPNVAEGIREMAARGAHIHAFRGPDLEIWILVAINVPNCECRRHLFGSFLGWEDHLCLPLSWPLTFIRTQGLRLPSHCKEWLKQALIYENMQDSISEEVAK